MYIAYTVCFVMAPGKIPAAGVNNRESRRCELSGNKMASDEVSNSDHPQLSHIFCLDLLLLRIVVSGTLAVTHRPSV